MQDEEIGALLQCLTPAETARALVDLANLRGGPDNITIVIARWKNGTSTGRNSSDAHAPRRRAPPMPSQSKAKFASPLMLAALACVIVAVGFGAAQATIPTFVALGIGITLALIGWLQQSVQTLQPVSTFVSGGRLGKGPHSSVDCQPSQKFADDLLSMIEQLREAAIEEHWSIDWTKLNGLCHAGKQAVDQQDFCAAVAIMPLALQFMMGELRNRASQA